MNAQHPRQFGYFTPPPLPMSIMGELLAQVANQGVDVWHAGPFAAFVEEEVVRWLCDLVGYGEGSFGLLTSGGVMANFMGMTLARDLHLGRAPRARGTAARQGPRRRPGLHQRPDPLLDRSSARRARLPARDAGRAAGGRRFPPARRAGRRGDRARPSGRADAVRDRLRCRFHEHRLGRRVGELADVAEAEGLWLHVDAAYGGGARLSARDRDRVPDLERADSVTVDPHKWFFQAYDIGGLLVRDGRALSAVFGGRAPEYYRGGETGARRRRPTTCATGTHDDHGDQLNFYKLSFEGTRRWRALKLWMTWKHLGTTGFGRLIEANDDLAAYLAAPCAEADDFEALPAVPELSVVCFRHLPAGVDRRGARRPPGSTAGGARGVRRRLADDDAPPRRDLAACRDRQLPLDGGGHRPLARHPSSARRVGSPRPSAP